MPVSTEFNSVFLGNLTGTAIYYGVNRVWPKINTSGQILSNISNYINNATLTMTSRTSVTSGINWGDGTFTDILNGTATYPHVYAALLAYYNFNNSFADVTNNGINLLPGNRLSYNYETGTNGQVAIKFLNFGTCSNNSAGLYYGNNIWDVTTSDASFSIWFKYTQDITYTAGCLYTFFGSNFGRFGFYIQPQQNQQNKISYGIGNYSYNDTGIINTGQWVHIVGTFNSSAKKFNIYRNGVNILSTGITGFSCGNSFAGFGINGSVQEYGIPIAIDSVGLWASELSSANAISLYNNGNPVSY